MIAAAPAIPRQVRRIVFFRPGAVGDFVFALPALHALKRGHPDAELVCIGRPWLPGFLADRPGPIDAAVAMPPWPGIGLPPDAPPNAQDFVDRLRGDGIDIAVQAYGGGRHANPFVRRLGARFAIGLQAPDAPALDDGVSFGPLQNRRLQLLELVARAGASPCLPGDELTATAADREAALRCLPADRRPLVVIQPGASDPRRRWPAHRFAAVADALAGWGAQVAVNGTAQESSLARAVTAAMRREAIDLSGRLTLGALCGLFERAALLVSNDTGPLHLAVALGTPAVGIYWFTNLVESQPLRQDIHRAAVAARVDCPVCGAENLAQRCPHDDSFVAEVAADEVLQLAFQLLSLRSRRRA